MISFLFSAAAVFFTFGVVILFHEFGHFIMCKIVGIRVLAFSFGFGSEIVGWDRGGTRYSVRWIPLGGFVKPAGEDLEEAKGEPDEFFSKPWHKRLFVVFAGPLMNYILGIIIFSMVFFFWGRPVVSEKPVIGELVQEMPAERAGLKKNDIIISIDSVKIDSWKSMAEVIHGSAGKEIALEYMRGDISNVIKITPELDKQGNVGIIGIMPFSEMEEVGLFTSIREGTWQVYFWTAFTIKYLADKIAKHEKPDIAGPVGIIQIVSKVAQRGMKDLLFLVALISVSVGWFNLLPIMPLDGGHAVFYIYEGVSRKKPGKRIMQAANLVGIAFVLFILIFATYNDIVRVWPFDK